MNMATKMTTKWSTVIAHAYLRQWYQSLDRKCLIMTRQSITTRKYRILFSANLKIYPHLIYFILLLGQSVQKNMSPQIVWSLSFVCIFFYSGYGYITPQTPTGQILCIFVSLLGIPITLLAFKSIGELIAKWVNTIVTKLEKKILKRLEPKHKKTKGAVILFSTMISLIALNGVLLMNQTDWTIVEGVYFWFITFTTIGFGDYVLGRPQRITKLSLNSSKYQESYESLNEEQTALVIFLDFFFTFYVIFTLCIVSSVLNAIMAVIEERRCCPRCTGCVPRKIQVQGDNDIPSSDAPKQLETNLTYLSMENYGIPMDSMASLSVTELK